VGKDPDIQLASSHVSQALGHWPTVGRDVVLHGHHVMAKLAQRMVDLLAVLFEVTVGGRDVDPDHAAPPKTDIVPSQATTNGL
jgi:hypothetical protein